MQALFRLLLRQSGGQFELNRFATLFELSRPTVRPHVEAVEIAHALQLPRPFQGGGKRKIVAHPEPYCFDTGFACFEKGSTSL